MQPSPAKNNNKRRLQIEAEHGRCRYRNVKQRFLEIHTLKVEKAKKKLAVLYNHIHKRYPQFPMLHKSFCAHDTATA